MPSSLTVPARIFQTWKDRLAVPPQFQAWSDSFRRLNPGFGYELWDDADNRRFITREFPWFLEVYNAYPAEIYRADAVRYFFLYLHGGIYVDMDTECLQPLDSLTAHTGVVLGRMGDDTGFAHAIPNAIMASSPRTEFWLFVIALLLYFCRFRGRPEQVTGPIVLKAAVDIYLANDPLFVRSKIQEVAAVLTEHQKPVPGRSPIALLPAAQWYPLNWNDPVHDALRRQVLAGHPLSAEDRSRLFSAASMATYWAHTWG